MVNTTISFYEPHATTSFLVLEYYWIVVTSNVSHLPLIIVEQMTTNSEKS